MPRASPVRRILRALARGLAYRCPACGRGRFHPLKREPEGCVECSHIYLRDPGDWTGSAEVALMLTFAVALGIFVMAPGWTPFGAPTWVAPAVGAAVTFGVSYPRLKGLWIGVIYLWDGPISQGAPPQMPTPFERPQAADDAKGGPRAGDGSDADDGRPRPAPYRPGPGKRRVRR